MKDYYSILGVSPNVSQEVLDAVYKSFVEKHTETGIDIAEITEAYKVLSDSVKRAEYDEKFKRDYFNDEANYDSNLLAKTDDIKFNDNSKEQQTTKSKNAVTICTVIMVLSVVLIMMISYVLNSSKSSDNIIVTDNDINYNENEPIDYYDGNIENEELEENLLSKKYGIEDGTRFYEGVAFIKSRNGAVFAINTEGKKLCSIEGCSDLKQISRFSNNVFAFNNCIYNKNGELIASPDKNDYDELYSWDTYTSNINGFFIAKKYVQSYMGDYITWGIINNQGDWVVPLSREGSWQFEKNPYLKCVYNWQNDFIFSEDKSSIEESESYFEDYGYSIDDKIFDYNDNLLIDLSEYNPGIVRYYNGIFSFVSNNGTGANYVFLLNKKNEFVIEPIRVGSSGYILSQDSNGILFYNDKNYEFCDYAGNIRNFGDYIVEDFNDGLALAYKSGTFGINSDFCYINYKGEIIIE